jgi:hypothetical protein
MAVQAFWYRLRELNKHIEWLPGSEPVLTDNQVKQAFYDAMPETWKDRYVHSGSSFEGSTMAQVVKYFRDQESNANKRQQENDKFQKRSHGHRRQNGRGRNGNYNPSKANNGKDQKSLDKDKDKKVSFNSSTKRSRISDDAPCPVHPGAGHKWSQCRSNAYNKDRSASNKKAKPNETQSHVAVATGLKVDTHVVALNDPKDTLYSNGTFTPDSYVNYASLELTSHSHHLDDCFLIEQDLPDPESYMSIMESFVMHNEDKFSTGDDNNISNVIVNPMKAVRLRPIGIMIARKIQNHESKLPLRVLFDPGSDTTLINQRCLPQGCNPRTVAPTYIGGVHVSKPSTKEVLLTDVSLPEFSSSIRLPGPIRATVFNNEGCMYDLILGLDVLTVIKMDVNLPTETVIWNDKAIPFRSKEHFQASTYVQSLAASMQDDPFEEEEAKEAGYKSTKILHSKYETVDPEDVAQQQNHLTFVQKKQLGALLSKYTKLFSGKLGCYPHRKVKLELKDGAKPYSCRPYPVPRHHEQVFKDELKRLCDAGVLSPCGASEWLSPTFLIPKKDGRVRWITDFQALNKVIKRKVYNLPKIQDILSKRNGYQYFSKIDISMHYYTFELDESSKNLCTICTPFGNYRYNRLAMGVSQSPDIAQEIMEDLFRRLEETDVYIDDVGVFNDTWESHLTSLDKVLTILQDNNFTVNPLKCEWGVKETDWLGYWLTPTGLKPWKKKIDAILAIKPPQTVKQLRAFLGAVNFYRDMYPKRSHILAPLTKLSGGKGQLNWTPECQTAFDAMKALLAKDAFLRYPDHNKPFHIYCDASDIQLGAAIFQDGMPGECGKLHFCAKMLDCSRQVTFK